MTRVSHPFALSWSKGFDRLSPNGMVSQFNVKDTSLQANAILAQRGQR
jgi:hypothetical protein